MPKPTIYRLPSLSSAVEFYRERYGYGPQEGIPHTMNDYAELCVSVERERCAQIAEDDSNSHRSTAIAEAIRNANYGTLREDKPCPTCGSKNPSLRGFMFRSSKPLSRCSDAFHPANH